MDGFWQLEEELRGQLKVSEDHQWSVVTSKLAELTKTNTGRTNNLDLLKSPLESIAKLRLDDSQFDTFGLDPFNSNFRINDIMGKSTNQTGYAANSMFAKGSSNSDRFQNIDMSVKLNNMNFQYGNIGSNREIGSNMEKRFKTLPTAEMLPRNEVLGAYIFVCNNDTMQEDLKRQLFGLPPRYRDSVRAITPGLPLFLYNYTTHQLHGIFEAASFGGSNIDPTAWEDKKCKGESRFPAQVRIRIRKVCQPLEEDSFRPVLHHYDGPKFRLELSVPETLQLLDLCEQGSL